MKWRGVTPENQNPQVVLLLHHGHAVNSAPSKRMIKEPTLPVLTWRLFIGVFRLVGIHTNTTNKQYQSHSPTLSLSLSLHPSAFLFLSLSTSVFSLCRISQISPLSYPLCPWNPHIHHQQCTIFRTNAILIFDFGAFPLFFLNFFLLVSLTGWIGCYSWKWKCWKQWKVPWMVASHSCRAVEIAAKRSSQCSLATPKWSLPEITAQNRCLLVSKAWSRRPLG